MGTIKEDIAIDPTNLDEELMKLPDQYHNYAEEAELQWDEQKRMELELEVLEADLDNNIRKNPKKFGGGDKVTETQIKSLVHLNEDWRRLSRKLIDAEKQRRLMLAACKTLELKNYNLKSLQELYLSEFYQTPNGVKKEKAIKDQEEIAARNVSREMKRRTKMRSQEENGTRN